MPPLLRRMTVGITPYAGSEFNRASFPLKTLEYLGAGLRGHYRSSGDARWLERDMARVLGAAAVDDHLVIARSSHNSSPRCAASRSVTPRPCTVSEGTSLPGVRGASRAEALCNYVDIARAGKAGSQ